MRGPQRPSSAPPARTKERSVLLYESLAKADDMMGLNKRLEETVKKTPHFVEDIKKINTVVEFEKRGLKQKTGKLHLNSRKAMLNRMRRTRDSKIHFENVMEQAQILADPHIAQEAEEQVKKAIEANELYIFKGLVDKKVPDRKPLERPWQTRRRRQKNEEHKKRQDQGHKKDGPTWSQAHESAFKAFVVHLQKMKSPMASADELVSMTAFLHYNSKLVHRLDKATIQLCREQKALENFCGMKKGMKRAGKRPCELFNTLGIGYTSKDQMSWRHLRWVLDKQCDIAISPEDLQLSVCRCLGIPPANTTGCTLIEFERALSVCRSVQMELDPIGVRDLPMTWAEVQELTWFISNEEDQEKVISSTVDNAMTAKTKDRLRQAMMDDSSANTPRKNFRGSLAGDKALQDSHHGNRRHSITQLKMAAKIAKWSENERNLAEQKVAEGIITQHEAFIWNYVKARNAFLRKRVQNQREQNRRKQFQRKSKEDVQKKREDFKSSVKHTKFLLKLYEQNRAAEEEGRKIVHPTHSPFKKVLDESRNSMESLGNEHKAHIKRLQLSYQLSSPKSYDNPEPMLQTKAQATKFVQFREHSDLTESPMPSPAATPNKLMSPVGSRAVTMLLSPAHSNDMDNSRGSGTKYSKGPGTSLGAAVLLKRGINSVTSGNTNEKVGTADVIERKLDKISCANLASVSKDYTQRVMRYGGGSGDYLSKSRYRKKSIEAASRLQRLFRRHIFWRNVWSQSYLRKPQHVLQIFQRLIPVEKHPGQIRRMNTVNHLADCQKMDHPWHWHCNNVHPDVIWDHQEIDLVNVERLIAEMAVPFTEEAYKAAIHEMKHMLKTSISDIAMRGWRTSKGNLNNTIGKDWHRNKHGKLCYAKFQEWWYKHLPFYTENLEDMIKSIHCAEKQHKLEFLGHQEKITGQGRHEGETLPGLQNEDNQNKLKVKSNLHRQMGIVPKLDSDQLQAGSANKKSKDRMMNVSQMVQQAIAVAKSRQVSGADSVEAITEEATTTKSGDGLTYIDGPSMVFVKTKRKSVADSLDTTKKGLGRVIPQRETTIFKNTTGYFLEKRQFLTSSSAPSLRTLQTGNPDKHEKKQRSVHKKLAQKRAIAHSRKLKKQVLVDYESGPCQVKGSRR